MRSATCLEVWQHKLHVAILSQPGGEIIVMATSAAGGINTVLYSYWRSSCSFRVRIMLHWKSIAFTYRAVHLARGEQLQDAHSAVNPLRQVPALDIDGNILVESQG